MSVTIERTRGDDWSISGVIGTRSGPVNLTGATLRAQMRRSPDTEVIATFAVDVDDALAGQITMTLDHEVTAGLTPEVDYVYDIEVVSAGLVTTYGRGYRLSVRPDVTR